MVRILRPLRFLNKNKGMRTAIKCMFAAVADMINAFLILLLFLLLFGVFGVN
jgi:hypothetical protein